MLYLWFLSVITFCDCYLFRRVHVGEQDLQNISSNVAIHYQIDCAIECMTRECLTFSYTEDEDKCIMYSALILQAAYAAFTGPTIYFSATGVKWTINVYIDTEINSESGQTLYMDVEGTQTSVYNVNLGNSFVRGETRQVTYEKHLDEIKEIRLHQNGADGIRVQKVTMEDESGHVYTFPCYCMIQTDVIAVDSGPSWVLLPQTVH